MNGDLVADIEVQGVVTKQVELSYSDKKFFVSTEDELPIDKIELWATVDEKYTPFHLEVEE